MNQKFSISLFIFLFFLGLSLLQADEEEERIRCEIQNWKARYKQDLDKLKSKLQELKNRQSQQEKTIPHHFDRMLDKYLKTGSEPVTWLNLVSPKNRIKFYGFFRLDAVYDSHRTDTGNFMFFVNNHNASGSNQDEELNIHARTTRFGFDVNGGKLLYLGSPEVTGKLELDLYGGGSESRNFFRMRHAYLKLNWTKYDIELLAGQTHDVISPLVSDSIDSNAIFWNLGNTGDRHPQLRVSWSPCLGKICGEFVKLRLEAAVLRTGAVDGQDIDVDTNNDGEDSGLPTFQWRVGMDIPAMVRKKPITFGVWGSHGWEETQTRIGTNAEDDFISLLFGLDVKIPVHRMLTLSGEFWWGRNVNDLRGGIGQGIDTFHGKEIDALGGWVSARFQPTDYFSLSFGYTFDNPQDEDVEDFGATGRRFNSAAFINNVWDLGSGVSVGYEYQYILTYYNRTDGSNYNNRGLVYIMYKF
jgi:hypothetical protein